MIEIKYTGDALWDRIEKAVEKVKDRLRRVTQALNAANIPYAIIGAMPSSIGLRKWMNLLSETLKMSTSFSMNPTWTVPLKSSEK